ncbi:GGDEF domain-containing protein [Pseudoalteromonas sp. MMG010]|uniref:GGDEF domain-containing protein n=1 Tax=Pseudoalteromonas sp. MMG010 TaxID=2822685 RepID=UPI001B3A34C6|nr:GGDEF domain-containing protein [Pseudoalteromonas sp. MMG010]MBQ4832990.1 GGDEF domain-containing protein [Pseudoalteromonas sp. MMG010]
MENVHILTQRISARGEFLPFSAEQFRNNEPESVHKLVSELQTSLIIEDVLAIYVGYAKQLLNFSGVQFKSNIGVNSTSESDLKQTPYSFDLHIAGEYLGQLTYFSKYPLSDAIEDKLLQLHNALLYPLRNALMYSRMLKLATKDALTGLNNRSQFNEILKQKIENCHRFNRPFSLMLLDLDNFKRVNDNYGHKVGDEMLQTFSNLLNSSIRGTDSVFRFGGDEFAILIEDPKFTTNQVIAQRIMKSVKCSKLMAKHHVTTSIGYTLATNKDNENAIFSRADTGLYKAKAAGRNCAKAF